MNNSERAIGTGIAAQEVVSEGVALRERIARRIADMNSKKQPPEERPSFVTIENQEISQDKVFEGMDFKEANLAVLEINDVMNLLGRELSIITRDKVGGDARMETYRADYEKAQDYLVRKFGAEIVYLILRTRELFLK